MLNGETLEAVKCTIEAFEGKDSEDVLFGFCQDITSPYGLPTNSFAISCCIAQLLLSAFDGNSFDRGCLPLGIHAVQVLDWQKLNAELSPFREEVRERNQSRDIPLIPTFEIDARGNECVFLGFNDEDLVIIDSSMTAHSLVKIKLHTFALRDTGKWETRTLYCRPGRSF